MKTTNYVLALLLSIVCLAACHNKEQNEHSHEKNEKEELHEDANLIELDENKAKAAGVTIETAALTDFQGVVKVTGKVLPSTAGENTVVATTAGVVKLVRPVTEGMQLGRGTAVFTISTKDLPEGDVVQRARIAYQEAKADYARIKALVADKIVTQKEFLQAKANFQKAALAYQAVGGGKLAKGITITTQMGGYVTECRVKNGDYVEVGQPLLTVSQDRNLYLRADVPERHYDALNYIVSANFKTSYSSEVFQLSRMKGKLVSCGRTATGEGSFIPVTFQFKNHGSVIPGAFADIYLLTSRCKKIINVPITAITEEQGVYFVYIHVAKGHYRKQEVTLGESNGSRVEILSGIKLGDKVVVQGAVHVKLAGVSGSMPTHSHES